MRYLIGIDDTDNTTSRGTGFRARAMAELLIEQGLATLHGITRHQLLIAPEIPYTAKNSSACLLVDVLGDADMLTDVCRDYLLRESADGSDAGLCVAPWDGLSATVQRFGQRAKVEVLTVDEALNLAREEGIYLEGLTGTGGGVIGSLAAVGLRGGADDGRFIWLNGIREVTGTHQVSALYALTGIDAIQTVDGALIPAADAVDLGEWFRPVLKAGRAVLLVEAAGLADAPQWRVAPKEAIKAHSN